MSPGASGYPRRSSGWRRRSPPTSTTTGSGTEALRRADTSITARPNHYMESLARVVRSAVWMARGRTDDALAESADALRHAQGAEDPSNLWPALGFHALMLIPGRGAATRPTRPSRSCSRLSAPPRKRCRPTGSREAWGLALAELERFDDVAELAARLELPLPFPRSV